METSGYLDPNHEFEIYGAYDPFILKIDGGTVDKKLVTVGSEDDDDNWFLA